MISKVFLAFLFVTAASAYSTGSWYGSSAYLPVTTCDLVSNFTGIISSYSPGNAYTSIRKCWKIEIPDAKYGRLILLTLSSSNNRPGVTVKVAGEGNPYSLNTNDRNKVITAINDVEVTLDISSTGYYISWNFQLSYVVEDIVCAKNSSFRCSDHSCIPESKVCDGVRDCEEGQDEEDCGIKSISGVHQSRRDAVSWLKKERTASTIWRKNTQRAITALYLADGVELDGKCEEEDMLDREQQLKTSVALWRNGTDPVTTNELGMFVHALLVSCHDPRRFYGLDLVRLLKEQVEGSSAGDHPLASLALCNADEPLSNRQVKRLQRILHSDSGHPFLLDVQAVALMALTCVKNSGHHPYVASTVNSTIARFREQQREDGSFGNIYTTALVIQALVGCGEEENPQWRAKAAIEFLLKQQKNDSSFGDFLATYLILPVLNAKSLVDIANVDCYQRKPRDEDPISDIENKLGPKINVKYMLYIGDSIDVAQSIFLRVPENITAYEIMEVAAAADAKYRFESHQNVKNIYIYSIAGIANDPEAGKFWLLHVINSTEHVEPIKESPDQRTIKDGESVLMWYKTASV